MPADDKAEKRLADYDARLTAVMAPDFKCWHQNSRDEWPEVAAWVINNLRQQIEVEKFHADKATAQRDRLAGLLREIRASGIVSAAVDLRGRIDAALAEVKP